MTEFYILTVTKLTLQPKQKYKKLLHFMDFPFGSVVKKLPAVLELQEMWVRFLGQEDPLGAATAAHSSILTWRIPWTEDPGELQPTVSQESDTSEVTECACMPTLGK